MFRAPCIRCGKRRASQINTICYKCVKNGRNKCRICGKELFHSYTGRPKTYCSKKCKDHTMFLSNMLINMRDRFLDPVYQSKQLTLVRLYWRKKGQPQPVFYFE